MDRETKTIITPVGKHKVVVRAWITGREQEEISRPLMECMKMSVKSDTPEIEAQNAVGALEEVKHKKIETVVVSVDGNKEKVLDLVLDMRNTDFNFVIAEVESIAETKDFTKPESGQEKDTGSGS